jgi:hemoglobin-like flavoprotein
MTPEHKRFVQDTWARVNPIADTAAELFYTRLFELDPALRPLFAKTDMHTQGRMLVQMLTVAVKGLDAPDQLLPAVEDLGRRHAHYGVEAAHYETVGSALLWTLERGLGEDFTPEVRDAWVQTFAFLSAAMKRASAETPDPPIQPEVSSRS